jgi:hypothetical protein
VALLLGACGQAGQTPSGQSQAQPPTAPATAPPTPGSLTPAATPQANPAAQLAATAASEATPASPATSSTSAAANGSPAPAGRLTGYAFNAAGRDVTLFDVASRQPLATRPLGATVRWLSNEQRSWDGRFVWTYDYPNNQVQAIAIDPRAVQVSRTIPTGGTGPAHSLVLTPDLKNAWVNLAGDNKLAVVDLGSGQVAAQVQTGAFP